MSSGSSGTKSMTSLSSSGEDVLAPLSGDVLDVGSDARRGNRGAITSSRDTWLAGALFRRGVSFPALLFSKRAVCKHPEVAGTYLLRLWVYTPWSELDCQSRTVDISTDQLIYRVPCTPFPHEHRMYKRDVLSLDSGQSTATTFTAFSPQSSAIRTIEWGIILACSAASMRLLSILSFLGTFRFYRTTVHHASHELLALESGSPRLSFNSDTWMVN